MKTSELQSYDHGLDLIEAKWGYDGMLDEIKEGILNYRINVSVHQKLVAPALMAIYKNNILEPLRTIREKFRTEDKMLHELLEDCVDVLIDLRTKKCEAEKLLCFFKRTDDYVKINSLE